MFYILYITSSPHYPVLQQPSDDQHDMRLLYQKAINFTMETQDISAIYTLS